MIFEKTNLIKLSLSFTGNINTYYRTDQILAQKSKNLTGNVLKNAQKQFVIISLKLLWAFKINNFLY